MNNQWQSDLDKSLPYSVKVCAFLSMSCDIINIEKSENIVLQWFDKYSGCDLIGNWSGSIFGIASRIQFIPESVDSWNTFTIRYERHTGTKTEYDKRIESMKKGFIYPLLTIQGYISNDVFKSAAAIQTKELYQFMIDYPELTYSNKSDNTFKFVKWSDLLNKNIPIIIK